MAEFIAPQDGAEKQACERNAVKRWFGKHHARLASLRPVYLGDDLFACQPIATMVSVSHCRTGPQNQAPSSVTEGLNRWTALATKLKSFNGFVL